MSDKKMGKDIQPRPMGRREFLKLLGTGGAALLVACATPDAASAPGDPNGDGLPQDSEHNPTPVPEVTPTVEATGETIFSFDGLVNSISKADDASWEAFPDSRVRETLMGGAVDLGVPEGSSILEIARVILDYDNADSEQFALVFHGDGNGSSGVILVAAHNGDGNLGTLSPDKLQLTGFALTPTTTENGFDLGVQTSDENGVLVLNIPVMSVKRDANGQATSARLVAGGADLELIKTIEPVSSKNAKLVSLISETKTEARVYTQEELQAKVPSKEKMITFLKSDEIVRVVENGREVPLGVGKIESQFGSFYSMEINAVPWDEPMLANVGINGETLRTMVIPVVIARNNNLSDPIFGYLVAGDENQSIVTADIVFSESGVNEIPANDLNKLSWYLERGRQFKARVFLNFDNPETYDRYVAKDNPLYGLTAEFHKLYGDYFRQIANQLAGGSLNDGFFLGRAGTIIVQGVGHPQP